MKMLLLQSVYFLKSEGDLCHTCVCVLAWVRSLVPKPFRSRKILVVKGYCVDSRVAQHSFAQALGIKDQIYRIVCPVAAYTFI